MDKNKKYSIRVDGHEIDKITLKPEHYKSQIQREIIRDLIADYYNISKRGLRLVPIEKDYIFVTNMSTGITSRFYVDSQDNDIDSHRPKGYIKTTKGNKKYAATYKTTKEGS